MSNSLKGISSIKGLSSIQYAPNLDAAAAAFITAAGISDSTQINAINALVIAAKANGWWTLCNAIYPFVGGTATTHKYNLKDPRDLDAAFRIVWNGSWTHNANGITGDGSTAYGDTKIVPTTVLTASNTHASIYCRTDNDPGLISDYGETDDIGPPFTSPRISTHLRFGGTMYADQYNVDVNRQAIANANCAAHFIHTRSASTSQKSYKNGSDMGSENTTVSTDFSSNVFNMFIGAVNANNTAQNFSNRNYAFFTVGAGISGGVAALMYADIQTFQTSLSRQV